MGQKVPLPLHKRVDTLARLTYGAGSDLPSKAKMLAAILLAAPTDPTELKRIVQEYEGAEVEQSLVGTEDVANGVVSFPKGTPGPRSP